MNCNQGAAPGDGRALRAFWVEMKQMKLRKLPRRWDSLSDAQKAEILRNTLAVLKRTGVAQRYPKEARKLRAWLAECER